MKRNWTFCSNTFEVATRTSNKKANRVGGGHSQSLAQEGITDPVILAMSNGFAPLHRNLVEKYAGWKVAENHYMSATLDMNNHLDLLVNEKTHDWELEVVKVYREGTSTFKEIFAGGLTSFREGSIDERIIRVKVLEGALKNKGLDALMALVGAFYGELSSKRELQQQAEQAVTKASADLEKARIAMCAGMYGNLGALMNHFKETPERVGDFFDLALLRSHSNGSNGGDVPQPITGEVGALKSAILKEGNFDSNTLFRIINDGVTILRAYTAKLPTDTVPGTYVEILPGEEAEAYASELGAETNLFLMVYNPDLNLTGEYGYLIVDETGE